MVITSLVIGFSSQLYIVQFITWKVALAAGLLPLTAFILAATIATLARQPKDRILTIALETSIQNGALAFVLVNLSLGQPMGDMAVVLPQLSVVLTPLPFIVAVVVKKVYEKCHGERAQSYNVESISVKNVSASVNAGFDNETELAI